MKDDGYYSIDGINGFSLVTIASHILVLNYMKSDLRPVIPKYT